MLLRFAAGGSVLLERAGEEGGECDEWREGDRLMMTRRGRRVGGHGRTATLDESRR